jgi:hypothetical protein
MSDIVWVALIASVVGPGLLAFLTNRSRRAEKKEDWIRQDAVAAEAKRQQDEVANKASEAAELLLAAQERTIRATDQVAFVARQNASDTTIRLQELKEGQTVIHTLVNSDMTAARQNERVATQALLMALRKVVRLDEDAGRQTSDEDKAIIETTETKIKELDQILADRAHQQEMADVEMEQAESNLEHLESDA